jgi:hypothetical protein
VRCRSIRHRVNSKIIRNFTAKTWKSLLKPHMWQTLSVGYIWNSSPPVHFFFLGLKFTELNNVSTRTVHVVYILASSPVYMPSPSYPSWFPNFNRKTYTHTHTHTHTLYITDFLVMPFLNVLLLQILKSSCFFFTCTSYKWPSLMLVNKTESVKVSSACALAFFSHLLFQ